MPLQSPEAIGRRLWELYCEFEGLEMVRDPRRDEVAEERADLHFDLLDTVPKTLPDCAAILNAAVTELCLIGGMDDDDREERVHVLNVRVREMIPIIAQAAGIDPEMIGEPI